MTDVAEWKDGSKTILVANTQTNKNLIFVAAWTFLEQRARNAARAGSFLLTLFSSELMSPFYRPDYSSPSLPKLSMNTIIILPPSPQINMVKILYVSSLPLFNLLTSKRRKMLFFVVLIYYIF
jgi:hypothetical protein